MNNCNKFTFSYRFPFNLAEFKRTIFRHHTTHNSINVHVINNNSWYHENNMSIFKKNEIVKDKKIISISPAGYKGFYVLGICKFIKQHYNLDNYIFSGSSAGSWNSLILCFRGNITDIEKYLIDEKLQNSANIYDMETNLKHKILEKYNTNDFDLTRLFIGVTTVNKYNCNTTIFTGFNNLEDAINCCIASSHIPLITGGLTYVYQNFISFDGGFSKYPYLNITKPVLHITPNIWKETKTGVKTKVTITDYTTLLSKNKFIFSEMVKKGYLDASNNKDVLDKTFK